MSSTNFITVRQRVHDRLYGSRTATLRGTVDSGSTTTIVDAAAALSGATADHMDYAVAKLVTSTDNLAPQGEVRAVTEGGFGPTTGTFTTVAFSAVTGAGDTYEIWPDQHPDFIDTLINRKLRELHMPSFFPLTLDLVDGDDNDMEASGVSGWTGVLTTPTKSTVAYNGAQSLTLTASGGALDYVTAGDIQVVAGESYYAAAMCQVNSGDSARLRIVNATTGSTIHDSGDTTQQAWVEMMTQWTAPSGCRTAQVQLMCVASGDVARFDDYQVWAQDGHVYPLPSWITRKEQLLGVYGYPQGTGGPVADTFVADKMKGQELSWRFERADVRADQPLYIYVSGIGQRRPYIRAYKPLAEVSFDYGSAGAGAGALGSPANTIPLSSTETDALVLGVMAELHRMKANDSVGETRAQHTREAQRYEREWDAGTRHLRPEWRETTRQSNRAYGVVA